MKVTLCLLALIALSRGASPAATAATPSTIPLFQYLGYTDSPPDCEEWLTPQSCNGKIHEERVCYYNNFVAKCEESNAAAGFAGLCMGKPEDSCTAAASLGCAWTGAMCASSYAVYDEDMMTGNFGGGMGGMSSLLSPFNTAGMTQINSLGGLTGQLDPTKDYYFTPDESDVPWVIRDGQASPVLMNGDLYDGDAMDGDMMTALPRGFGPPPGAAGMSVSALQSQLASLSGMGGMTGMAGMSGMAGMAGMSGMSGMAGMPGMAGMTGGMSNMASMAAMANYMDESDLSPFRLQKPRHSARPVFPRMKNSPKPTARKLSKPHFDFEKMGMLQNQLQTNLGGNVNSLAAYSALGLDQIPGFTTTGSSGAVGCWIDHPETDYPIPCPNSKTGDIYGQTGEGDFPIKYNTNTGSVSPYNALNYLVANQFQVPGSSLDLSGLGQQLSVNGLALQGQFAQMGGDLGDAAYLAAGRTGKVPLWQMYKNLDNIDTDSATLMYQQMIQQKMTGTLGQNTAAAPAPAAAPAAAAPAAPAADAPAADDAAAPSDAAAAPADDTGADAGTQPMADDTAADTTATDEPAAAPAPAPVNPATNILNYYVWDRIVSDNVDDLSDLQGLVGLNQLSGLMGGQNLMSMAGLAGMDVFDDMMGVRLTKTRVETASDSDGAADDSGTDSADSADSPDTAADTADSPDTATDTADSPDAAAADSDTADTPDTAADDTADSADSDDTTAADAPTPPAAPTAPTPPTAPQYGWNNIFPRNGEYDFDRMFGQMPGPGQYYAQSGESDFPTIQGPGAPPQPVQLDEMDFPVLWNPTTNSWSIVQKPNNDYPIAFGTPPSALSNLYPLTTQTNGGSPLFPAASPILGSEDVFPLFLQDDIGKSLFVFQGRAFTRPQSLAALNSLQSFISENDFPTDVGSVLSGSFDLEDMMKIQASQAQMSAYNNILGDMTNSLQGQSLGMYTRYGASPMVKYDESGAMKLEDTIFGEENGVLPDGRGGFMLNPAKSKLDGFESPFLQSTITQKQPAQVAARPLTENPWFWGFLLTSVMIISGSVVACQRRKTQKLDDLLLDQRSQQV